MYVPTLICSLSSNQEIASNHFPINILKRERPARFACSSPGGENMARYLVLDIQWTRCESYCIKGSEIVCLSYAYGFLVDDVADECISNYLLTINRLLTIL